MSAIEDQVRAAALRLFRTEKAAEAFLEIKAPALGGAPLELVRAGRGGEVLAFLDKLEREAPAAPSSMERLFSGWFGRFGGKR